MGAGKRPPLMRGLSPPTVVTGGENDYPSVSLTADSSPDKGSLGPVRAKKAPLCKGQIPPSAGEMSAKRTKGARARQGCHGVSHDWGIVATVYNHEHRCVIQPCLSIPPTSLTLGHLPLHKGGFKEGVNRRLAPSFYQSAYSSSNFWITALSFSFSSSPG